MILRKGNRLRQDFGASSGITNGSTAFATAFASYGASRATVRQDGVGLKPIPVHEFHSECDFYFNHFFLKPD